MRIKTLVIATLLLLSFIGQAVASSMVFCSMDVSDQPNATNDQASMHSSMMTHISMSADVSSAMNSDACGIDCSCIENCSIGSILYISRTNASLYGASVNLHSYKAVTLTPASTSLFRPPIVS
jgi:hypothetical protein